MNSYTYEKLRDILVLVYLRDLALLIEYINLQTILKNIGKKVEDAAK